MMKEKKTGVTLLELLMGIILLSLIVIGFSNINLFSHYQVINSERVTSLRNTASYVLSHMTRNANLAIGNVNDRAIVAYGDGKGIRIRIDNGTVPGKIDGNDRWVAYRQEDVGGSDSEIRFYPNAGTGGLPAGGHEVLGRKIKISDSARPVDEWGFVPIFNLGPGGDNYLEVTIRTCWEPIQISCGTTDNPGVQLRNFMRMPSVSVN